MRGFPTDVDHSKAVKVKVHQNFGFRSFRPHLKLNTFELKYTCTCIYHFKMFLIDLILKIQTLLELFVCNQEINIVL